MVTNPDARDSLDLWGSIDEVRGSIHESRASPIAVHAFRHCLVNLDLERQPFGFGVKAGHRTGPSYARLPGRGLPQLTSGHKRHHSVRTAGMSTEEEIS